MFPPGIPDVIWVFIFGAGIVQGGFLLLMLLLGRASNRVARVMLSLLIVSMILGNADFLLTSSLLYQQFAGLFGIGMGMLLLVGPALYWYARSILRDSNPPAWIIALHFLPYVALTVWTVPFVTLDPAIKIRIIEGFIAGSIPMDTTTMISYFLQNYHLIGYLIATALLLRHSQTDLLKISSDGNETISAEASLVVSVSRRTKWLSTIIGICLIFASVALVVFLIAIMKQRGSMEGSYWFALVMTLGIYLIALVHSRAPEMLQPDFSRKPEKYRTMRTLSGEEREAVWKKVNELLDDQSLLTDPEMNLQRLSESLHSSPNLISRVINESSGKSFPELISERRITEFIARAERGDAQRLSIYGLALEVGFNSKSTFNQAFKRVTGTTPSAYLSTALSQSINAK